LEKVGVAYHPKSEAARRVAEELRARLAGRVREVWLASAWEDPARERVDGTQLLICCGGDGTVLRAARAVIPAPVALLGVKLGRVGFLTEIAPGELFERLDSVVEGAGRIETRAMIETEMERAGEPARLPGDLRGHFHALNDVVVGRAAIGRTVQFSVRTDDTAVGHYRADGVIVATATGSTAYSLSVGGPILHPESREIIVTPVAPHLAPANSVVLPAGSLVDVEIAAGQSAILSIDGEPDMDLSGGDIVRVRTSEHTARFLRLGPPGEFYERVGRRLNWLYE
jgi:NAD+ kinase